MRDTALGTRLKQVKESCEDMANNGWGNTELWQRHAHSIEAAIMVIEVLLQNIKDMEVKA